MVASRKFLQPINLLNLAEDPASGTQGDFYYNTTRDVLKFYDGAAWVEVGSGTISVSGTAPANPIVGNAWFDNTTGAFYIYDGSFWVEVTGVISGGIFNIVEDTTPQLGGDLDAQSYDITNIDNLGFDLTPDNAGGIGELVWNSGDGTLDLGLGDGSTLRIGQQETALCYNGTGATLTKGTVVYITGAQGQRPALAKAAASSESTSSKTFGLVAKDIANGAEGMVTTFGIIRGLNTFAFSEGAALWLSTTAGEITTTMPIQPNHGVFIGYCVRQHATAGQVFVKIQNGYELQEIHNVLISSAAEDNVLRYDSASSLWKNTRDNIVTVTNTTGSTIAAFTPVHIYEELVSSTTLGMKPADCAAATPALPAHGITTESVSSGSASKVVTSGVVRGLTLTGYTNGDLLYVASGGGFTKTRPTGTNSIQPFGVVLSTTNGTIYVNGNTFVSNIDSLPNLSDGKVWRGDAGGRPTEQTLDTSIVPEDGNLYFTEERSQDTTATQFSEGTHTGISVSYNDTNGALSLSNTGVLSLTGTANEIEVSSGTGNITLSMPSVVVLPSDTSIGDVSSTEIGYLNGVTSGIQSQLDGKAATSHSHISTDITDFTEAVQDTAAGMITAATHVNMSVEYNDSAGTLTFTANPAYDDEAARDAIATAINAGTHSNITFVHDDTLNTFSFGLTSDVTIADDLTVTGDLNVLGNITYANDLVVDDPLIYIGEGNTANLVDLGLVGSFNDGAYQHTGIVRDATDGKWKFFSSVEDEPTTVINFAQAAYDTLLVGTLESSGGSVILNSLQSGSASADAYLTVERGTDANVAIRWNEVTDAWEYTNDGSTYNEIGSGGGGGSGGSVQTDTVLSNSWWLGV